MVKKQHKFLCLVLCLALIATAVMVGAVSAFAASGDTVYVKANNGWTNLHCYMWNGNGEQKNADWPGVKMTEVGDGVYSYTLSGDFSKIIFNKGEGGNGNQTTDMDYPGANKIYDLSAGTWGDYGNTPTNPDPTNPTPTTPTPTTPTPTTPSGDNVVYFKNTDNWSVVKCYMWNSDSDKNAAWSGEEMTNLGDGVWMYTAKKKYAKCIFNNGNDQTDDLTANYGQIYDRSTKQWSPYDVNDLRITSFTADPASDVYTGSEVTLTAEAASKSSSNVFYKFSVTNASGGSSVVSDFSTAKSVSWTPTAAGSYTVTLDVKDDAGNDNSRTLSLTVAPDTGVTNPIIKKVTPANLNLIKMGSTATVSVTAGGGQTGTNLMVILETRLDNVVFRMGFARTRREARQVVLHKFITVNGKVINIPSYLVKAGDVIEVKESAKNIQRFKDISEITAGRLVPEWLDVNKENLQGTIKELPSREAIDVPVDEMLIVELYSK